ncbi:MAG TPA: YhjD/YihY/BrkB family envelope integrity protein [Solirubrobacterales bacterium]|jgi:uncharacterized BrkB/YihY/UPF0761 family membrane protein|nr:YhjD/YihY/BrkB family envelope integrity protein [Solirubrobacterales bacterium]
MSSRPRAEGKGPTAESGFVAYGTLGGLVALLVWFWISNLAILFGHQLNAERERSAKIEEGMSPGG